MKPKPQTMFSVLRIYFIIDSKRDFENQSICVTFMVTYHKNVMILGYLSNAETDPDTTDDAKFIKEPDTADDTTPETIDKSNYGYGYKFFAALKPLFDSNFLQTLTEFALPDDFMRSHNGIFEHFEEINACIFSKSVDRNKLMGTGIENICLCSPGDECRDSCINRLMFYECSPGTCPCKEKCTNMRIQQQKFVQVEEFTTKNKGNGVKIKETVKKETLILEYVGEVTTLDEYNERARTVYKNDLHQYGMSLERKYVVDAHRVGNISRIVNHSCEPNCNIQKWIVNGFPRLVLIANRDIESGEELSYDYNFTLIDPERPAQICYCESKNFRKFISEKSSQGLSKRNRSASMQRSLLPKLLSKPKVVFIID